MPERVRPFDAAGVPLALLVSVAAFGCIELGWGGAAFLAAIAVLSIVFRLATPKARLRRVMESLATTLALASLPVAYLWTLYPVVSEVTLRRFVGLCEFAFAGLIAIVLLLRSAAWPARRPLTIGLLALLVAGALDPEAPARAQWAPAAASLSFLAWLLFDRLPFEIGSRAGRLAPVLGFTVCSALLALGIARFLPWAQPKVEAVTSGMLAPKAAGVGYAGLSFNSRLGDIEELALSRRVVMRVETEVPQRLRARVFTHFDGKAWRAEPAPGALALVPVDDAILDPDLARWFSGVPGSLLSIPGRAGHGASAGAVRTRIVQTEWNEGALATPALPELARLPGVAGRIDDFGILTASPPSGVEMYAIVNRPDAPQAPPTRSLGDDLLELPRDTDPRILLLAERLAAGAPDPESRVSNVTRFLGRECRYALNVGAFSSRQPVAEFLFSKKRGYCEFFATAAALLLRAQGVRTRYVTGFNVRDDNLLGGRYVVRESDAHAWIEVYLHGKGFVEVDPTPSAQYAAVHDRRHGWLASLGERLAAFSGELLARIRGGDHRSTLLFALQAARLPAATALLVVAAILGARRWRRGTAAAPPSRTDDPGLPTDLTGLVHELERHWRGLGHPRPPSRALQEHNDAIPYGAAGEEARHVGSRVIACYYRARYGGVVPEAEEIQAARAEFEAARDAPHTRGSG